MFLFYVLRTQQNHPRQSMEPLCILTHSTESLQSPNAEMHVTDDELTTTSESSPPSRSSPEHSSAALSSSECSLPASPEMDIDSFLGPEYHPSTPSLLTYHIVGDNIDKNIKPRNMTSDHQTRSLHYFHAYAVRDRIDLSSFSSDQPVPDMGQMNFDSLLPSSDDVGALYDNLAVMVGRIIRTYVYAIL